MEKKKMGCIVAAVLLLGVFCTPGSEDIVTYVWKASGRPVVVLDPGHGGMDGGAESPAGLAEKDINLSIAVNLKKLLEREKIRVIMTREDDKGLYDYSQESSIRSMKTQDMHVRKQIIDKARPQLVVSIHLNSFTQDSSVKGAQVFYPDSGEKLPVEGSKRAAEIIQTELNEKINVEKERTELGKSDVFLLQNITGPIVIVECGFLSNKEDEKNLKDKEYQEKIAKSLKKSICNYLRENGNKTQ